jgi:hypothetical protein
MSWRKTARPPVGFIYRFVPNDKSDLGQGGKPYALQVQIDRGPIVFSDHADEDGCSDARLKLHKQVTFRPISRVLLNDSGYIRTGDPLPPLFSQFSGAKVEENSHHSS